MTPDPHLLRTLASPRRQELLRLLWTRERTAGELREAMSDVTFGAVSQHLAALRGAGLVEVRAEGTFRHYRVRRAALGPLRPWLERMWADALWTLKLRAELEQSRRGPRRGRTAKPRRRAGTPARSRT